MQWLTDRYKYLFSSTKGLILVAIALIALFLATVANFACQQKRVRKD